ncbi:MAG: hypothetical protein AAFN44_01870 [Pseudomonadota bacterium]
MNSYLSALVGLTGTWFAVSVASLAAFDPTNGFSPVTLTFLSILGLFTVIEAARYSRALKKQEAKADIRRDSEF